MKFLADECCDRGLVGALRKAGFDVLYVLELKPGATDDEILALALDERRIILTEDKDFGELVYRLKKPTHGIILIRIGVKNRSLKWPRMKKLLDAYPERCTACCEQFFDLIKSSYNITIEIHPYKLLFLCPNVQDSA